MFVRIMNGVMNLALFLWWLHRVFIVRLRLLLDPDLFACGYTLNVVYCVF